jgi:hypothetical protein
MTFRCHLWFFHGHRPTSLKNWVYLAPTLPERSGPGGSGVQFDNYTYIYTFKYFKRISTQNIPTYVAPTVNVRSTRVIYAEQLAET